MSDVYEDLARANRQEALRLMRQRRAAGDHRVADRLEQGLRRAGWQPGQRTAWPGIYEKVISLDRHGFRRAVVYEAEPGADTFAWARAFTRGGLGGRLDHGLARQAAADESARREGRPITRTQQVQVPIGSKVQIVPGR